MNVPLFLITSTRGAPASASMSTPSRLSLATAGRLHLRRRVPPGWEGICACVLFGGGICSPRASALMKSMTDFGRLHAVGVGEVVVLAGARAPGA